jgi:hypothetical protein
MVDGRHIAATCVPLFLAPAMAASGAGLVAITGPAASRARGFVRRKPMRNTLAASLLAVITLSGSVALPGELRYMQLTVGQSVEIAGQWQKDRHFKADDVEVLPGQRRPKLRGAIIDLDSATTSIKLFDRWIRITDETQFVDAGGAQVEFKMLRAKERVEVSCKVDSTGNWIARHIRTKKVKESDKIKGTISRLAFDGHTPDTLSISGLLILVTDATDVFKALGSASETENDGAVESDSGRHRR